MIEFILDTDVGSDADDLMALAYLANMQKKGVLTVKAVSSKLIDIGKII
jgi:inosine-uridine nucleoside N-ribohydrolase